MDIYELLNVLHGYEDGDVSLRRAITAVKKWLKTAETDKDKA